MGDPPQRRSVVHKALVVGRVAIELYEYVHDL
jgi:hypothetical protein